MTDSARHERAGRVGRAHGLDGSFYVEEAGAALEQGTELTIAGRSTVVERRAGTPEHPIVRVRGVDDRNAAEALRGESLFVAAGGDLEPGEYLTAELVGCRVEGVGEVRRVIAAPSCDLLEVGDEELLIPFVADAVKWVDTAKRSIEIDRGFLGLDAGGEP